MPIALLRRHLQASQGFGAAQEALVALAEEALQGRAPLKGAEHGGDGGRQGHLIDLKRYVKSKRGGASGSRSNLKSRQATRQATSQRTMKKSRKRLESLRF